MYQNKLWRYIKPEWIKNYSINFTVEQNSPILKATKPRFDQIRSNLHRKINFCFIKTLLENKRESYPMQFATKAVTKVT